MRVPLFCICNPAVNHGVLARSLAIAFLFITTEIIDDLDGIQARSTGQCSKYGEVLDHLVDAFGIPILGATIAMGLQFDNLGLVFGILGPTIMFNLQLVLYQRSGKFVEPPISGPRGACIGTIVIILGGGLIAIWGREHLAVAIVLTIVNVASLYGVLENIYFYYGLLVQHEAPTPKRTLAKP